MKRKRTAFIVLSFYSLVFILAQFIIVAPGQAIINPNVTAVWNNKLNQVNVEWTGIPSVEEGQQYSRYHLYYKEKGTNEWIEYSTIEWGSTGKGVTGLKENTEYEFVIKSQLKTAEENGLMPSNIATATTKSFTLAFSAKWTGSDVLIEWRNAQTSMTNGVQIWYKAPNGESQYIGYAGYSVNKERHSMYVSSITKQNGEPFIEPKEGETWTFGVTDSKDNQAQASVNCWTVAETNDNGEYVPSQEQPGTEEIVDTGNIFEQLLAGIITFPVRIVEKIAGLAGFKEAQDLVFTEGHDFAPWHDQAQKNKIYDWFKILMWAMLPLFVFVIAFNGFRMLYASANPVVRAESMEGIQRWFLSLGIMLIAPFFVDLLMIVSGIMTDSISLAYGTITGKEIEVLLTGRDIATGSFIGTAIVQCMFVLLYFYFNIIYLVRMVAISVMLAFTPLMAMMWAIKKDVTAASVWVGELASNAFMPVAHALVICVILLLVEDPVNSWVQILIMMYCLIPLSEVLRNSMMTIFTRAAGLNEQRVGMGALGAVMGLGGLVSMGRIGGAMFAGNHIASRGPISLNKKAATPQFMANPKRTTKDKGIPLGGLDKTVYSRMGDKGVYMNHNWSAKNPMPAGLSAIKPTKPTGTGKAYRYKTSDGFNQADMLNKAVRFSKTAGMVAAAPAVLLSGAVPGGTALAGGAYAAGSILSRGAATAGLLGKNIAMQDMRTGDLGKAVRTVTGAGNMQGAVRNTAGTIGGSMIMPNRMIGNALQANSEAEARNRKGMAVRQSRMYARMGPITSTPKTKNTTTVGKRYQTERRKYPNPPERTISISKVRLKRTL